MSISGKERGRVFGPLSVRTYDEYIGLVSCHALLELRSRVLAIYRSFLDDRRIRRGIDPLNQVIPFRTERVDSPFEWDS